MADVNMEIHMASQMETFLEEFSYYYSKDTEKFSKVLSTLLILAANSEENLKVIASQINMEVLYASIIYDNEKALASDACKLLSYVLSRYSSLEVIAKFGKRIIESIDIKNEKYQAICLKQVFKLADDDHFSEFMSNPAIIILIFKYLGSKDISSSSISRKILNKLTDHDENTGWFFSTEVSNVCIELLDKNATVRFRVYEVFIDFIQKYPDHVNSCAESQIFEKLMKDLFSTNDILSQLNALELVSQIALSGEQGMQFIEQKGILNWLQNTITSDDPLVGFLLPGAIKCFGVLATSNPAEVIPKYELSMNAIFENLKNNDPSIRCLCAETVAFICSKTNALKLMYNNPDLLKNSTKIMGKIMASPAESDVSKGRILESLATIFKHDPTDIEVSMICEKLFQQISNEPVSYLLNMVQQPFLVVRYGGLKVLRNVSVFSWVEQDMALCAGFLEYLLNRRTESEKEGRELKYDIIKNLALSNTSKDNLGLSYYDKIIKYAKEGPFYSESEVAVTYEGEN